MILTLLKEEARSANSGQSLNPHEKESDMTMVQQPAGSTEEPTIGGRLRERREATGLSIQEVCDWSWNRYTVEYWAAIESGSRQTTERYLNSYLLNAIETASNRKTGDAAYRRRLAEERASRSRPDEGSFLTRAQALASRTRSRPVPPTEDEAWDIIRKRGTDLAALVWNQANDSEFLEIAVTDCCELMGKHSTATAMLELAQMLRTCFPDRPAMEVSQ